MADVIEDTAPLDPETEELGRLAARAADYIERIDPKPEGLKIMVILESTGSDGDDRGARVCRHYEDGSEVIATLLLQAQRLAERVGVGLEILGVTVKRAGGHRANGS